MEEEEEQQQQQQQQERSESKPIDFELQMAKYLRLAADNMTSEQREMLFQVVLPATAEQALSTPFNGQDLGMEIKQAKSEYALAKNALKEDDEFVGKMIDSAKAVHQRMVEQADKVLEDALEDIGKNEAQREALVARVELARGRLCELEKRALDVVKDTFAEINDDGALDYHSSGTAGGECGSSNSSETANAAAGNSDDQAPQGSDNAASSAAAAAETASSAEEEKDGARVTTAKGQFKALTEAEKATAKSMFGGKKPSWARHSGKTLILVESDEKLCNTLSDPTTALDMLKSLVPSNFTFHNVSMVTKKKAELLVNTENHDEICMHLKNAGLTVVCITKPTFIFTSTTNPASKRIKDLKERYLAIGRSSNNDTINSFYFKCYLELI
ncbi:hypothetical protein GGI07_005198 [Coemansia sp. Benny D115]|nr:hypothetical protein GGI07_005198 [Coemansia sp. Benny D115]